MKKQIKKLTLCRETLLSLEEKGMAPAVGGTFGTLMECTYMDCSEKCFIDPHTVRC
ncbi:MAG TPA: class I lanthipeptide [Thermoanaerobaculia bacterium]|jgi:hypothetical protein|nr:class I lanthipeptide [Thermoanaerobaculia bacterium]